MKNVVAYSLWGDKPIYWVGAKRNIELAKKYYPGWVCRFYIEKNCKEDLIESLRDDNVEIILVNSKNSFDGSFWRFWAAVDLDVDIMLSRDADSRITEREVAAVNEWLNSNKDFHIMRDHPYGHGRPILAGMWGCRNKILQKVNFVSLINNWENFSYYGCDQDFLGQVIYPLIKNNAIEHCDIKELTFGGTTKPFPTSREGYEFVGDVFDENDVRREDYHRALVEGMKNLALQQDNQLNGKSRINYVIIASDDNPTYKDFYPIVAKRWNDLGIKTYFINISDRDDVQLDDWGIIRRVKALDFVSSGFQAQVVRLYAANFITGNLLISDIDMLPINGNYFTQYISELSEDNVILFTGQPYVDRPYFPMCYVLANSEAYKKYLEIGDLSFYDYCKMLVEKYGEDWFADEHFMYESLQKHSENLIIKKRQFINSVATQRIDRVNWQYDLETLRKGEYVDSHLLRPYKQYSEQIDSLIKNLNNVVDYIDSIRNKTNINPATILEIGSRDGYDAENLRLAFQIKSNDVWIVEPNPSQLELIKKNYPDINLLEYAIYNKSGKFNFNRVNDSSLTGVSSLLDRIDNLYDKVDSEKISVQCITGKALLNIINKDIDLCKIDVEGLTHEVLTSFGDNIDKIKSFHLECEHRAVWDSQKLYKEIAAYLREKNYVLISFNYVGGDTLQSDSVWVNKKYAKNFSANNIQAAEQEIQNGNIIFAVEILNVILQNEPTNIDALNDLALAEILNKNLELANSILQKVLKIEPGNQVALGNKAYLSQQLSIDEKEKKVVETSIVQSEKSKLLTIVLQGRNDSYMGNFEWRLSTNINKLSETLHELNLVEKVQVLLVDWGSNERLTNVLTLSEEAKNCLEFVHVPKGIAAKYNKDSEYSMVHAINTGIKKAKGKYVLFCDGDTYTPVETMKNLVVNLRRGCIGKLDLRKSLFMASRYHIPKTFQTSGPSLPEIDKYIKEKHHSFNHDKINLTNFMGTATAYLMLKELWFECRGFDESLIYWGWFDIDLFHRIKSKYGIHDFEDFGMPFYHLEHYGNSKNRDMKAENPRKINPAAMPKYFTPNDDNWGLANEELIIEKLIGKVGNIKKDISGSELNNMIPPEIKDDEFYNEIVDLAKKKEVRTVLEIGSSSGGGSTEAFVKGLRQNPGSPKMFCMEISKNRFAELKRRYETDKFVQCYNVSSVAIKDFPSEDDVKRFYSTTKTSLNLYPIEQVLGWLQQDIDYVSASCVPDDGIQIIREENNLQNFDLVLIDGSEFTGSAELKKAYGAKYILLDDINAYKNYESYQQLLKDPNYVLIKENWKVRNGYAIFKFKDEEMPVHFFTIVLNGEPFIRYHIDLFKQLPFKWHWHIIEGVAELKNDTAWSVAMGGKVSHEFHRNGLSKDGTTKYLDGLKIEFPDNITIYRKGKEKFWNGKLEMVNAPLKNIDEESLLIEIDADELWTFDQILETRKMFLENPAKTAAYFWCHFYVGGNLVTTIKNAYSKTPYYEWIRAWRFNPGNRWTTHEPPALCMQNGTGQWMDLAKINPFLHNETEAHGLVFHHYAYVLEQQLKFKEIYYGYQNALHVWQKLQNTKNFPVLLKDYFSWVKDLQQVDTLISQGIKPVAVKDDSGQWKFDYVLSRSNIKISVKNNLNKDGKTKEHVPDISKNKIIIDGVIFQIQANRPAGISRVWTSLLTELSKTDLADSIVLLDRGGTSPEIQGIKKRNIFRFSGYWEAIADSYYLQDICDAENGLIFMSTYYTYPSKTHSIMMLHDFIPELHGWQGLEWKTKKKAIEKARAYLSVSNSTAKDLKRFYPGESLKQVFVISNAVSDNFKVNSDSAIESFKTRYKITKPYFLVSGTRIFYKNIIQFVKAFSELKNKEEFEILFTGGPSELEADFLPYLKNVKHQVVFLSNEDLSTAYSGAVALVYPSKYEGFGLPLLEAMKSGCPVITCRNSSLTEVAGDAAIYVEEDNIYSMKRALSQISSETLRKDIIKKGIKNAQRFSWTKSADLLFNVLNKKEDELQSITFNEPEILDDYNELFYRIKSDKILGKATSNLFHLFEIVGEVTEEEFTKEEEVIGKSLLRMIDFNLLSEISTNYRSPYLLYLKGLVHLYNEQEIEAFKSFIEVLKSDFKHWWIAYSAALIALKYNEYNTARQLLEPVLRVKPTFEGAKNKLKEIDRDSCPSNLHSLVKVSAIISTYNSEKYIDGCLQDLVEQTLFKKGEMEIIVVNTGSQQNEKRIVNKFQQKYLNIKYVETKTRETIYAAWNIAIAHSQGKLLTNANTDDRHKSDALEIMAAEFDKNPDADVVYADIFTTVQPNDNWGSNTSKAENKWIQFDKDLILFGCFIGPQPMWKRSLHEKYGNFREELKVVGDYEFWLRISREAKFIHLNEKLGLYFYSTGSVEHKNKSLTEDENRRIQNEYFIKYVSDLSGVERIKNKLAPVKNAKDGDEYFKNAMKVLELREKGLNIQIAIANFIQQLNQYTSENFNKVSASIQSIICGNNSIVDKSFIENFYLVLGVQHFKNGNIDQSKKMFDNALKINGFSSNAYVGLGEVNFLNNNYLAAGEMFTKALKIDPKNQTALNGIKKLDEKLNLKVELNS